MKVETPFDGLLNPYSGGLLLLMITSLALGGLALFNGWLMWGLLILIPGGLIASGFRILSPGEGDQPRQVGLITVLGQRTQYKVEGLTLACDQLGFNLVGITIIRIKKFEKAFPIKSVRCFDNIRLEGLVSLSVVPDEKDDDERVPKADRQTGADKLWDWFDIGSEEGYFNQVNDILVVGLQEIVGGDDLEGTERQEDRTYKWAETHPTAIQYKLLKRIKAHRPTGDNDELDDTRGLGGKIKKIQVTLTPINKKVVEADEDRVIEELQQVSELKETETINKQVLARFKLYTDGGLSDVSMKACRDEIMFERLAKDKKVTIVQGGQLVNLSSVDSTDRVPSETPRGGVAGAIVEGGRK